MQIEGGKYYLCSCGETIGPMRSVLGGWTADTYSELPYWDNEGRGIGDVQRHDLSEIDKPRHAFTVPDGMEIVFVTEGGATGEARPAEGRKDDGGKPPLHLIAPDFLYALAEILDFGAKKYAPRNWEKGMDWSRCYRAAVGHLLDWFMRKGPDPETGKSHLWHAACCVMFLVSYEIRGVGKDDRP